MPKRERPRLVLSRSDAAKLERIWNDHATTVLGMLKAFCASPEDAQDALQELFLRVGKNIAVVESAKSPRAFLIVAARRIAIDSARKRAADQRRHESPETAEAVHPSPAPAGNDPETAAAILAAVRELPQEQRAVFEAKILQGKTLAVIAAEQSITLNTAASRLRYSLDKIRGRLRPHYESMKNQSNKPNTLSDSPERLIRPLEPKRVPSVVPGLEGAAALAVDDFHQDAEPEVVHCELPPPSFENFEEPILVVCPGVIDLPGENPDAVENVAPDHVDPVDPSPFPPPAYELGGDPSDIPVDDLEEILTEIFKGETPVDSGSEEFVGEDWTYFTAIDGDFEIVDDTTAVTGEESGTDDSPDWNLGEYYNDLLKEYGAFLVENPDWISENSGGDMQAQVITPSQYTGLELADPGAARAFDLWFEKTYLSREQPTDLLLNEDSGYEIEDSDYEIITKPFDSREFLLTEYKAFLGENPDWILSNSGSEIQPQVMTFSRLLPVEFGTPSEASAFDQWYHATYIAPYSSTEVQPVEGGSVNLSGDNHTFGTEICFTTSDGTGIPKEWLRDGIIKLKGDGLVAETGTTPPPETLILGSITDSGIVVGEVRDEQEASEATPTEMESGTLESTDVILEEIGDVPVPVLGGASQTVVSDGALLNSDKFATTGIPEPWMRGGAVDSSSESEIAFRSNAVASEMEAPAQDLEPAPSSKEFLLNLEGAGPIDAKNLTLNAGPTPVLGSANQTVVTGGTLDINLPVKGTFTVEKGGAITAGEQTFGEGTYQFSEDGTVASVASQDNEPAAAAPVNQVTESTNIQAPAMAVPAVPPIVSGSDSVIESPLASAGIEHSTLDPVELPVLVETASHSDADSPAAMDDIAITEDDSFVPAPAQSAAPAVATAPALANDNVTAAVGGAFVAGTATQVAPVRGASIRKELPLKP